MNRRGDFPIFDQPLTYLDTAATAQKPRVVIDAVKDFYTGHYGTVHRAVYRLSTEATTAFQQVRAKLCAFLNAPKEEEIIFTRGTTEAINLVARSFGSAFLSPGDTVIVSEIEHHANLVPWQMVCKERGVELKVAPVTDSGDLDLDRFAALLDQRTKLVAIAEISNAIGTHHPIEQIAEMVHSVGGKLLVDGAQAAGHLPVDLQRLGCDFYAFSGHKLYGPTGIGVLWGRSELLEQMPPALFGGDMVDQVSLSETTFGPLPLKFEAGTPPIAQVVGLGAALKYLDTVGKEAIANWEQELTSYALERLAVIDGLQIIGMPKRRGAIISFIVNGAHPLDIGTLLDLQGIAIRTGNHCAQTAMQRFGVTSVCRLSFGLYNRKEDVDHFIEALQIVLQQLR